MCALSTRVFNAHGYGFCVNRANGYSVAMTLCGWMCFILAHARHWQQRIQRVSDRDDYLISMATEVVCVRCCDQCIGYRWRRRRRRRRRRNGCVRDFINCMNLIEPNVNTKWNKREVHRVYLFHVNRKSQTTRWLWRMHVCTFGVWKNEQMVLIPVHTRNISRFIVLVFSQM